MAKANPVPKVTNAQPGTAERFLEVAKSQIGVIEGPKDNETDYGKFTGHDLQAWCGSSMMWIADKAGVKIPDCVYTPNGANAFKKMGAWADAASAHPEPGDLAFFSFVPAATPSSPIQHIGVVVKDNGDGTVTTYEGNTSSDARPHGSQNNGGLFQRNCSGENSWDRIPVWGANRSGSHRPFECHGTA